MAASAETLEALSSRDMVRFAVADQEITGMVYRATATNDRIRVVLADRSTTGGEWYRIETQWSAGWLDPQVDVFDESEMEYEPVGTLSAIDPID